MYKKLILIITIVCLVLFVGTCDRKTTVIVKEGLKTDLKTQEEDSTNDTATAIQLEQTALIKNDFILYFVNCATENVTEVAQGDYMGLYQSVTDQVFSEDSGTGISWGYLDKPYLIRDGDVTSSDKQETKWVIDAGTEIIPEETGFFYDFSVPSGEYAITCGFYDPFSARPISIQAEGETAIKEQKILKYMLVEYSFTQQVSDGILNLLIYNPVSGDEAMKDPILSYIFVCAVPKYDEQLLTHLVDAVTLEEEILTQYTESSNEGFQAAYDAAKELLASTAISEKEVYEKTYLSLKEAYNNMIKKPVYTSFRPGQVWKDMENNLIQAHGGQVQRLTVVEKETGEVVEKWWWVGEDKSTGGHGGICAYSSVDLYSWTFEGIVMRNVSTRKQLEKEEYYRKLYCEYTSEQLDNVYTCINDTTSIIERPKMIHCEATGQYVIWFHADGPTATSDSNYAAASAGVAVSDSPVGPFKFIDRYRLNTCPADQEDKYPQSKGMARDMNLFLDEDGSAYIIYSSEENLTLYISKLNASYTYLATDPKEARYGEDYIRIFPGAQREAPALFIKDGKYYMMTSGCTGWAPNPSKIFVADSMLGNWIDLGDPCIEDRNKTTFDSQSTCIFLADEATQTYIYMGDRWKSEDLANSRYIWLPVNFDEEGKVSISYVEEWQLP